MLIVRQRPYLLVRQRAEHLERARVTVGAIMGLLASGRTQQEILSAYPYLEAEDVQAALAYAAQY